MLCVLNLNLYFLEACTTGYFGDGCVNSCINTCTGCNNVHGLCDKGCHSGWKGDYCLQRSCSPSLPSFFSFFRSLSPLFKLSDCSFVCIYLFLSLPLSFLSSELSESSCFNGNNDETRVFRTACLYGFYGQRCEQQCNVTCTGCNNTNGVCDNGCKPGWEGTFCEQGR